MWPRFPEGLDDSSSRGRWADWVELCLVYTENQTFSRDDMREGLELNYAGGEEEIDEIVEEAFREIAFRQSLLNETYPLVDEGTHIAKVRSRPECLSFACLLALSVQQFYEETKVSGGAAHEPAKLFEHLVAAAIRKYLNGSALRIGSPREPPVPAGFGDSLEYLAELMGERVRGPLVPHVGDADVDVVGWMPFADGKAGQFILLAQCKTGKHWDTEIGELSLDVWREQMAWATQPAKAIAFPYVFDGTLDEWRYIGLKGGVPFDRLRLGCLVRDADLAAPVLARVRTWCEDFASKLPYAD